MIYRFLRSIEYNNSSNSFLVVFCFTNLYRSYARYGAKIQLLISSTGSTDDRHRQKGRKVVLLEIVYRRLVIISVSNLLVGEGCEPKVNKKYRGVVLIVRYPTLRFGESMKCPDTLQ